MTKTTLIIFFIILINYELTKAERGCPFRSSECKQHCTENELCGQSRCGGWLWQECKCLRCPGGDDGDNGGGIIGINGTSTTTTTTTTMTSISSTMMTTAGVASTTGSPVAEDDTNKVGSDEVPHEDIIKEPL